MAPTKKTSASLGFVHSSGYNLRPRLRQLRSTTRNKDNANSSNFSRRRLNGAVAARRSRASPRQTSNKTLNAKQPTVSPGGDSPGDTTVKCAICLDTERSSQTMEYIPCGHGFHAICCEKWLSQSSVCPICRTPVVSPTALSDENNNRNRDNNYQHSFAPRRREQHLHIRVVLITPRVVSTPSRRIMTGALLSSSARGHMRPRNWLHRSWP